MKSTILSFLFTLFTYTIFAQAANKYVKIVTEVKPLTNNEYNLIVNVVIDKPWHIYSQKIKSGGPIPTSFTFTKNPLIQYIGKPAEVGNIIKKFDNNFKIDLLFYSDKVQFIQKIKCKAAIKTQITADMKFMICNDEICLPPSSQKVIFNL